MNSLAVHAPEKTVIQGRFSNAAGTYDRYARHHRFIRDRVCDFLPPSHRVYSVFEIGCGTGILTGELLERYPGARIRCIDIAPGMITLCRNKWGSNRLLEFEVADAEEYIPGVKFDLVVSSCAVQWFSDIQLFVDRTCSVIYDDGVCVFAVPVDGMLHELAESYLTGTGRNMNRLDLRSETDWKTYFMKAGLVVDSSIVEDVTVTYSNPREVLRAVRGIGAVLSGHQPVTPPEMRTLIRSYSDRYTDRYGRVLSTYRMLYITGRKSRR